MTLTDEQQAIINTVSSAPDGTLVKVEAVAGSSKTFTSVKVAEAIGESHILYLAYNKSIAEEAKSSFPHYVECKTTHSLAYSPTIIHGLTLDGTEGPRRDVGFFGYRDIKEKIKYEEKLQIIELLEEFFLSEFLSVEPFLTTKGFESKDMPLVNTYFHKMLNNDVHCTHSCYLKLYHILLANGIIHYEEPYRLIILDEAGDINPVTLEIFKLLPAKVKLLVGDSLQNIYSFNHTINGFNKLKEQGITLHLSKSFRCSEQIADEVEYFIHNNIDDKVKFSGTNTEYPSEITSSFISRYNSTLIAKMIELIGKNKPFRLLRDPAELFKVVLIIMNLNKGTPVTDPRYRHLREEYDEYMEDEHLQTLYKSVLVYIIKQNENYDKNISSAAKLLIKYSADKIYKAYNQAKQYKNAVLPRDTTVLTTAHSSKGLTFTKVELANDFPVGEVLKLASRDNLEDEELRLYYVACTRASHKLTGAKFLDPNYKSAPSPWEEGYDAYALQEIY